MLGMDPRAFVHAEQVFFCEPHPQAWELGRKERAVEEHTQHPESWKKEMGDGQGSGRNF